MLKILTKRRLIGLRFGITCLGLMPIHGSGIRKHGQIISQKCSHSLTVKLQIYTLAMPLDEGMI